MKDIVRVYLLNDLIFEIVFEKKEKIVFENSFFEGGVEIHTPLVLKGLRGEKRVKKGEDDSMGNEWNLFPRIYGSCFSFLLEN